MSELSCLANILHIPEIKTLNLSKKQDFSGLEKFVYLQDLKISNSHLRYIPSEISSLKYLKILSFSNNDLSDISSLPKSLKKLDISYNNLTKVNIEKLKKLSELNISNNRLQYLDGISHLISLKYLYCSSNLLSSLHAINNIELLELDISDNCIKNIEILSPVLFSLQVVCFKNNPCCKNGIFSVFFHNFTLQGEFLYARNELNLKYSKLLKNFIQTNSITLAKGSSVSKALKELDYVKEKNRILDKKVTKLEKLITCQDIKENDTRLHEIELMSYED